MLFAYVVLRPSVGPLASDARLQLWQRVFSQFFPLVWASIIVLLATGYSMIVLYLGGVAAAPLYVGMMQALGILMMLIFFHLYFVPWRRFSEAATVHDLPKAAEQLNQIRRIVGTNLVLGLITIAVGASGRFW
jgi:uncharacterized membrane protein